MQRLLSSLIAATAVAAVALPAAAQQPPSPPTASYMPSARVFDGRPNPALWNINRAQYETFLDSGTGNNLPAQPLERIDLANRVSTLIELGRCTDARNEAREAGDRLMALRARQLCRVDRPSDSTS